MPPKQPPSISAEERRRRLSRVTRLARKLGFVGQVEYRHVYSSSGGAQFGLGRSPARDLLLVYAEAFDRDIDPDDFSLEAIMGHERGHQVVLRELRLQSLFGEALVSAEEILASLAGSLIVQSPEDRKALLLRAIHDAVQCGVTLADALRLTAEVRALLERIL